MSQLSMTSFYVTSFYVTSFICSSVHETLTIFSTTSALVQKLACQLLNKCTFHRKNCQSTNFVRLYGSTKKTCQSNLSIWCDWPAFGLSAILLHCWILINCQSKLVETFTPVNTTCHMKTCHIKFVAYAHVHLPNKTCHIKTCHRKLARL
jgi:hypothetical protein